MMEKITVGQFKIAFKLLNQMFGAVLSIGDDAGPIREAVEHGADVNVHNNHGDTLLHLACEGGSIEIIRYLLEQRADIDAENDVGETPLYWAANTGNVDVVKVLLEAGADASIGDEDGETPLHCVLRHDPDSNRQHMIEMFARQAPDSTLEIIRNLPGDDPDREIMMEFLRQYAPEAVMEAYCSPGPGGGR